jgi:putative ABC transport system permease protein
MRDFTAFVRRHLEPLELPRHRELQIVEELAAQLEDAYDGLLARGLSDEEAWRELQRGLPAWQTIAAQVLEAESTFVRVAQPAREPRTASFSTLLAALQQRSLQGLTGDLRAAVRLLLKDRGFSATTILTLAVCLGAHIAIFTVVYAVLLRPLPVRDAGRIVALGDVYPTVTPNDIVSNTVPSYFDRLAALTSLDEQAMFTYWYDTLPIDGIAQELRGMRATPSLFRVLQVPPALGRTFTDAEGEAGSDRKIILSHGLWQTLFGGDPNVVGKDVRLGWTGQPYTIVGVMPSGFAFFEMGSDGHARAGGDGVQFWLPLTFTAAQRSDDARTRYGYFHIGRLKAGATIDQVRAQATALNEQMFARFPQYRFVELGVYTAVTPLQDVLTGSVRRVLYLLWGGAGFVLLIGALNIANLSLARARTRGRELATRMALGAGRLRLTRQLIVEGLILASVGGLAGFWAGGWLLHALVQGGLPNLPNATSIHIETPVVACAIALTLLCGVLIGLVPAASLGRRDLQHALADASRSGTAGRSARLFRRGLIVTQVALSVVLLIGAALLLTTFRNLLSMDVGFDGARVISGTIFPPPSRYQDQQAVAAVSDRLLDSIRTIPGVEAAGVTSNIALSGHTSPSAVAAADRPSGPTDAPVVPSVVAVSAGYFETMGTRLVRGRYFANSDNARSLPVAIVDERLASRLWPNEDPIGKALLRGSAVRYTVVGVVRDVAFESPAKRAASIGTAYFAHTQAPPMGRLRWITVKTAADPATFVPMLRQTLAAIDRDLPLSDIQTMGQREMGTVVSQKLAMTLATLFGVVALLLSAVGIYGVLAFVVARRTREIGVRMALGSSPRGIFRLVFGEGLVLVAGGVTLGLLGAFALRRVLEDQVFGVTPTDPAILAGVSVTTGLVALLACTWPARRAARVDPLIVLKEQ